jgi:hypothetical protein
MDKIINKEKSTDNSRRTMLKGAFVIPCLITFKVGSLKATPSGPSTSTWTGGKPSAPK